MLEDYEAGGGKLLVSAGPTEDGTLTNLYSLLENYGVTAGEGIVVEEDREHYAFGAPYVLLPDLASSDVTDSLIDESYYALMPISQGLTVGSTENGTVTELLTTSDTAFSKAPGTACPPTTGRTATSTAPLPWASALRTTAAARSSGSAPRSFWRICTTPIPPAPTWTWP